MDDEKPPHSLDDFDARLRKAREREAERSGSSRVDQVPRGAFGLAFRIGIELVAAMIVGVGGGLVLDYWLGTSPWGLIVMFILGAGAGIVNVYRAVSGLGYAPGYRSRKPQDRTGRPGGAGDN